MGITIAFIVVLILVIRVWSVPGQVAEFQGEITRRRAEQDKLRIEVHRLRDQVNTLLEASLAAAAPPTVAEPPLASPVASPSWVWDTMEAAIAAPAAPEPPMTVPAELLAVAPATLPNSLEPEAPALTSAVAEPTVATEPEAIAELFPLAESVLEVEPSTAPELIAAPTEEPVLASVAASSLTSASEVVATELVAEPAPAAEPEPTSAPEPTTEPEPAPMEEPALLPEPEPVAEPEQEAEPEPVWVPLPRSASRPTPPPPRKPRRPAPKPVPTGPTWWDRAATVLLENWTGILGAVVLVTGVGFLGIYAALHVAAPIRFLMICAFAAGLLGTRYALREKTFAQKLNAWLLSSAAAIFLFACVGAVSNIEALHWTKPPFDYLLLLVGIGANLYLAWQTSRQEVATLHGVLSLVALAVLPPTTLTLATAAGVTAFSIAITYRQRWKYQLLLSIASFFAFHLFWHQELRQSGAILNAPRLAAMALVLLVGVAAAVVQYRRVYAQRRFEPLLFTAHLLNWTCLGINLYLYSTGSVWKTIPLALGSLLTFWAGRRAKQLGIGWLFQTDTIISLILALATALSLQGWHATPTVIGLFMLLESLLITLIMARQREVLVYRVALSVALAASAGLLGLASFHLRDLTPTLLYREVLVLALAGWAGLAFVQLILRQPLLRAGQLDEEAATSDQSHHYLLHVFAGLTGLLQAGAGLGLARILFGWSVAPVAALLLGLAGVSLGLATWVRTAGRAPSWVRWQQLVLAQLCVVAALLGLHQAGMNWSGVLLLLYAESLLVVLLLAGRAEGDYLHQQLYRVALGEAAVIGLSVLLRASSFFAYHTPSVLYREALVLALAGGLTLVFGQLAAKWSLLAGVKPYLPRQWQEEDATTLWPLRLVSNHAEHLNFANSFAALSGIFQLAVGLLLNRLLFSLPGTPVALLLGLLAGLAAISLGLAAWVRTAGRMPGWVRWQQLVLAQFFTVLVGLGLHQLGLNWSAVLLLLYFESLLVVLLLAGRAEHDYLHQQLYRVALAAAALVGLGVLLRASNYLIGGATTTVLYREALVLALAGWATLAFVQMAFNWSFLQAIKPYVPQVVTDGVVGPSQLVSNPMENRYLVSGFASLAGGLQVAAGVALARILFGWSAAPVAALLLGLAGVSLGLATWVRTAGQAPSWVRWQQLVLAQLFVVLAVLGLHEAGMNWSVVLPLLYLESLLVLLLLAGRAEADLLHQQLYRVALGEAAVLGLGVLLRASGFLAYHTPSVLYREALVLALAGWTTLVFGQLAARWPLLQIVKPYLPAQWQEEPTEAGPPQVVSNYAEHLSWVGSFAGVGGVLQATVGVVLSRMLFGLPGAPVALLLGLLAGLAAVSLGLATWVRTAGRLPGWVRWQQLVLAQFFVVLAISGLHEVGASWSTVLFLAFVENLLVALLLGGRAAHDLLHEQLYRVALAEALLTGAGLLLLVGTHLAEGELAVLYREALLLALAGWAALAFRQLAFNYPLLPGIKPYLPRYDTLAEGLSTQVVSNHEAHRGWLSSFAGLAGLLQAEVGLVVGYLLFGWAGTPTGWLLGALGGLAVAALGLAAWVRTGGELPNWVRRQQLVLAQGFAVLAVFGLHELGLSWPGILAVLYAENLVFALLLSGRNEDSLLHFQTYLLVAQAVALPVLVRYTSPDALGPQGRAWLLVGTALLTLSYQARRLYWRRAQAEVARLSLGDGSPLPILGLAVGWLLLGAGSLVYAQAGAGWAFVALLGALLYLSQRVALPGLWTGLVLAAAGYVGLQWSHVLHPLLAARPAYRAGSVLLYLLPTLAVPGGGLLTSWWVVGERYVRWPWLYLLGAHLVVALVAAVPTGHLAYLLLGLLALSAAAFAAAQAWRRTLADEAAVWRAGQPDRYLLHLSYGGLLGSLVLHSCLVVNAETLFGIRAAYLTAGLFCGVVAALAAARPPAGAPVYASWQRLHPWLPEVALLVGTATLAHNLPAPWLPLVWVGVALALAAATPWLALRFRRLGVYGRLYYWLAAFMVSINCLIYAIPSQLLSSDWWALAAAVGLLFGYAGLALHQGNKLLDGLSPTWAPLAQLTPRQLEAWLLYPAFLALSLLLIQSFDRSVLTLLLMIEVVVVFSGSLLLRRQDLRYVALAGMLGCMGRLLFFDLRQSGTVTRAIVFIFMGLLLLGMNALYARFKGRFAAATPTPPDEPTAFEEEELVPAE